MTYDWQKDKAFVDWVAQREGVSYEEALTFRYGMEASHEAWIAGRQSRDLEIQQLKADLLDKEKGSLYPL